MIARKNPVKAPRNASVIERLLKVWGPWLVRMNPVYAIASVQRIMRTENMGSPLDQQIIATIRPRGVSASALYGKDGDLDILHCLLDPSSALKVDTYNKDFWSTIRFRATSTSAKPPQWAAPAREH